MKRSYSWRVPDLSKRTVLERSGGDCECKRILGNRLSVCGRAGTDLHHIKARSAMGHHHPCNLVLLSPTCHRLVHDGDPATAGLKVHSWEQEHRWSWWSRWYPQDFIEGLRRKYDAYHDDACPETD